MGTPAKKSGTMPESENLVEYILINYRWVFVCLFLMPASLIYDTYMYFRCWLIFKMSSAPEKHDEKVKAVQRQVREG